MNSKDLTLEEVWNLFVFGDLLQCLPLPYQVEGPIVCNQHLRGFREGIVVLGGHARAVRSRGTDHEKVTNMGCRELTRA